MKRRLALLSTVAFFAVVLTGCSRNYDAWFVNPCGREVRIETFVVPDIARYPSMATAQIPPQSIVKVDDAFTDAGGFDWRVQVAGYPQLIEVDGRRWVHDTVLIPTDACADVAGSQEQG